MRSTSVSGVAAVVLLLAGCSSQESRRTSDHQASSPPRRTDEGNSGKLRTMYFPTGQADGSTLRLDKDVPDEVRVGETFDETLTVKNITSGPLDDVVVRESLSPNFEPAGGDAEVARGEALWHVGALGPGESKTLRLSGKAKGEGDLAHCTRASFESRLCTKSVAVLPRLELSLNGPREALSCEPLVYEGVVRNTGTAKLKDVRVQDALPEGLTLEDGEKRSFGENVGDLNPGESRPYKMRLKALRPGTYSGQATATSSGVSSNAAWNTVVREPVLQIDASGPGDRYTGTTAQAVVTVKNAGDAPSPETAVEWTLPAGASFTSASESGQASGKTATWQLGTLAPGESRRLDASYTSDRVGSAAGLVKATSRCAKPAQADLRTEFRGVPAVLLEVTDDHDPAHLGERVTYTIEVTNQGSARLTNVRVVCDLEDTMALAGTKGETEARQSAAQTLSFEPLGSLETSAKAVWKVTVTPRKLADARFKVRLTADQLERPVEETESTHFIGR